MHTKSKRSSEVWLHFIRLDANSARCVIHKKDIVTKTGNIANLMKHLNVHGIIKSVKLLHVRLEEEEQTAAIFLSASSPPHVVEPPSKSPPLDLL